MEKEKMYCWECRQAQSVTQDLIKGHYNNGHGDQGEDEWSEPYCEECHSDKVSDYECGDCKVKGSDDELLIENNGALICHRCLAKKEASSAMFDLCERISQMLISKFSFKDDKETLSYSQDLLYDIMDCYYKRLIDTLRKTISDLLERESLACNTAFNQYRKFVDAELEIKNLKIKLKKAEEKNHEHE